MKTKDTAVTFFVLGMVAGMVVAFASCSTTQPDISAPQQQTQQQQAPLNQQSQIARYR